MTIYFAFGAASVFAVLIYNLLHWKQKKALLSGMSQLAVKHFKSKNKKGIYKLLSAVSFWLAVEIVLLTLMQYPTAIANPTFGNIFNTGANYFGTLLFGPILVVVVCVILKIDPLDQLDLVAPAYPLGLALTKLGCLSGGCCRGFEWEHGFYNPFSNMIEFPSPLLESAVALIIFIFLLLIKKKLKKGTVFPVYLMVYSFLRFFTEFTRCEPEVFLGLKAYQWFCIAGVIVGALEYLLAIKFKNRLAEISKLKK